jgi:polyferredoxin
LGIVVGLIMLMAVVFGRFVCGWICPFGLYMDLLTRLRKFLKIKHKDLSESFNERFHQLGYVILALWFRELKREGLCISIFRLPFVRFVR